MARTIRRAAIRGHDRFRNRSEHGGEIPSGGKDGTDGGQVAQTAPAGTVPRGGRTGTVGPCRLSAGGGRGLLVFTGTRPRSKIRRLSAGGGPQGRRPPRGQAGSERRYAQFAENPEGWPAGRPGRAPV